MTNLKKILVPTDFSEHSSRALRFAADLARKYDAALTLLHVNDLVVTLAPYPPLPPKILDTAMTEARALLERAKGEASSLGVPQVETNLIDGRPFHEIVRFAEQGDYDLIVMGTHGRSGFNRVLLGSVAERVVRGAGRPVLTVPLRGSPESAREA
ncbi:MAG TPA: universal stress protein [Polyangiaceae bacterium]